MIGEIIPYYSAEALEILKDENAHLIVEGREFAPVKHGHWIDVNGDGSLWRCSACGETQCCKSNYCGDCGAYMMDGDKNE